MMNSPMVVVGMFVSAVVIMIINTKSFKESKSLTGLLSIFLGIVLVIGGAYFGATALFYEYSTETNSELKTEKVVLYSMSSIGMTQNHFFDGDRYFYFNSEGEMKVGYLKNFDKGANVCFGL